MPNRLPSGENAIPRMPSSGPTCTAVPTGSPVAGSWKRTRPLLSPAASSCPSGLTANALTEVSCPASAIDDRCRVLTSQRYVVVAGVIASSVSTLPTAIATCWPSGVNATSLTGSPASMGAPTACNVEASQKPTVPVLASGGDECTVGTDREARRGRRYVEGTDDFMGREIPDVGALPAEGDDLVWPEGFHPRIAFVATPRRGPQSRLVDERGEQRAVRRRVRAYALRLHSEQQREAPVALEQDRDLGNGAVDLGGDGHGAGAVGLAVGTAALTDGYHAGADCDDERDRRRDEQDAQAPVGAFAGRDPFAFLRPLGAFLLGTRIEELGLELVELCTRIAVEPVARGLKARTTIELAGITAERVPVFGRVREVPVRAQPFTVVVEPAPQPRPFTDQCFVRDLDGVIVDGDQTPVGKVTQHLVDRIAIGARYELGTGDAPPGVLGTFAELGEPQEDAARDRPLLLGQRLGPRGLGGASDGAAYTA